MTQQYLQMVTPYGIKLVFVQKITFIPRKINKNAALFDFNMHQIVCRLGLCRRLHCGRRKQGREGKVR